MKETDFRDMLCRCMVKDVRDSKDEYVLEIMRELYLKIVDHEYDRFVYNLSMIPTLEIPTKEEFKNIVLNSLIA